MKKLEKELVGKSFENNDGHKFTVTKCIGRKKNGSTKFLVQFHDTGYEREVEKVEITRGKIKDRYRPVIFDRGYIGDVKVTPNKRAYNIWYKVLQRCYDPLSDRYQDYGVKGVTVHPRWFSFENFVNDIKLIDGYDEDLYNEGKLELDKDKKQFDSTFKIYSLDTCTWLSKAENNEYRDIDHLKFKFKAKSPNGAIFIADGLKEFCRQHQDLHRQAISLCLKGKQKAHKGWTFKLIDQ